MYETAIKKNAVKKAEKEGGLVARHEGRYIVCAEAELPGDAKVVWKDGENVGRVKKAVAETAPTEPQASPATETDESSPLVQSNIPLEEDVVETEEASDDPEGEEEEESSEDEEEPEEEGESIETEESLTTEAPVEETVSETPPVGSETRLPKVVIRQTGDKGAVSIGTIDLRQAPAPEMIKELEDLESSSRVIATSGACHAYPVSDESWADLMESCIGIVQKYYSEEDHELVIDRLH